MTDNQAMEITEGLDDTLGSILRAAFRPGNSDMLKWADLRAAQLALDAALSRPATPAAGDAEVERMRIVDWLRDDTGKGSEEGCEWAGIFADAIEREYHHA